MQLGRWKKNVSGPEYLTYSLSLILTVTEVNLVPVYEEKHEAQVP